MWPCCALVEGLVTATIVNIDSTVNVNNGRSDKVEAAAVQW